MVQPKSPPISFRPSAELLAEIDAIAERRKMKRHATILRLLAEGVAADVLASRPHRAAVSAPPPTPKPAATAPPPRKAVHVSVPLAGTFTRRPYQKTGKR